MTLSWSDGSSCGGFIHSAAEVGRLHRRVHHQLDLPVCAGDGLSYHSGETVTGSGRFEQESASLALRLLLFSPQEHLQAFCFLVFLFFCVSCGLFIKFNVPEIKNLTALQIAAEFQKMHAKRKGPENRKLNQAHETKL